MTDRAISAIDAIDLDTLSFQWLRSAFRADNGLKDTLSFGHAVLDSTDKLDQYLHTYGPMIESQWTYVSDTLKSMKSPDVVIDYGCGQGLAGLLVNDLTEGRAFQNVRQVLLIDPSKIALDRAEAIYRRLAPTASVRAINKSFDGLKKSEMHTQDGYHTLHLFSNSLDLPGFDPVALLPKTAGLGTHTLLAVSHDRDFNGGTPQIERVKAALDNSVPTRKLRISESTLERFTCDNPNQSKAVAWLCQFEVRDG